MKYLYDNVVYMSFSLYLNICGCRKYWWQACLCSSGGLVQFILLSFLVFINPETLKMAGMLMSLLW